MRDISSEEAKTNYGITTCHHEMPNGECRFRLLQTDGTAYVRTQSSPSGGWQSSHYHKSMKETYIVQKGWIAYAAIRAGERSISLFHAGDQFTVPPQEVHNVYLPAGAVLHTVKHGHAEEGDRVVDPVTAVLDKVTRCLTEEQIRCEVGQMDGKPSETYTAEYRHFDTLIWQLPVWCTAIFAASALGTNSIQQATFITEVRGVSKTGVATGFLILMSIVLLALGYALSRFRWHQRVIKRYPKVPIWSSASTYLQMIVTLQAVTLLFLVSLMNGLRLRRAFWGGGLVFVLLTIYREYTVRRESRTTANPPLRDTR